MSNSIYLRIDWKSGQFMETSKEDKEGFEEYKNGNDETRWKKLYPKGITAKLHNVELKESPFGMQLVTTFVEDENWYNVQIPVLNPRDQVTEYAIELGRFLPNLQKGEVYRVFPYLIEADGKENKYDKRGISFKLGSADGEKVVPALSWMMDADDSVRIPRLDWKIDPLTKKKKPTASSVEGQRNFLAGIFQRETERIGSQDAIASVPSSNEFGPPSDGKQEDKKSVESSPQEEYDDLPF